jgi:hypothetical protein
MLCGPSSSAQPDVPTISSFSTASAPPSDEAGQNPGAGRPAGCLPVGRISGRAEGRGRPRRTTPGSQAWVARGVVPAEFAWLARRTARIRPEKQARPRLSTRVCHRSLFVPTHTTDEPERTGQRDRHFVPGRQTWVARGVVPGHSPGSPGEPHGFGPRSRRGPDSPPGFATVARSSLLLLRMNLSEYNSAIGIFFPGRQIGVESGVVARGKKLSRSIAG